MTLSIGKNKQAPGHKPWAASYRPEAWMVRRQAPRGFALLEVMVSVAILSVGLVLVLGSFITAIGALQTSQNRIYAIQLLEEKMAEIEQEALQEGGTEPGRSEGEFVLKDRRFDWTLEVAPVEEKEDLDLSEELNVVRLTVSWLERGSSKDVSVVTYLGNKK